MGASAPSGRQLGKAVRTAEGERFKKSADTYRRQLEDINRRISALSATNPATGSPDFANLESLRRNATSTQANILSAEENARRRGIAIPSSPATPATPTT